VAQARRPLHATRTCLTSPRAPPRPPAQTLLGNSSHEFIRDLFQPDGGDDSPTEASAGAKSKAGLRAFKFNSVGGKRPAAAPWACLGASQPGGRHAPGGHWAACSRRRSPLRWRSPQPRAAPPQVGTQFKKQLAELMGQLQMMEPHYIRCIKPNNVNKPALFDGPGVLHQLRCGGVLEAVRISCAGELPAARPPWPRCAAEPSHRLPAPAHACALLPPPLAHICTHTRAPRRLPRQAALRRVRGPLLAHGACAVAQRGGRPHHRGGHPQEVGPRRLPARRHQGGTSPCACLSGRDGVVRGQGAKGAGLAREVRARGD
jgi:hypothetical protein